MKRNLISTLAAVLCLASAATFADAQRGRHVRTETKYYAVPGMSMRIYPPSRQIRHINGLTIYPGPRHNVRYQYITTGAYWPYGPPPGYVWPYQSVNYRPYGR